MASHDPYASLRIADFRRLIVSHAALTIATQLQAVVVGWQVYAITKDPLSLGLVGLAEALPFIAVALYAGHVADRTGRRGIALVGTVGMAGCAIALLLFTISGSIAHNVLPIYAVIFVSGIARSFIRPATTALSAEIVPREIYPNAVAWRTSVWQFAAVVGPAVGGLLYGFSGPTLAYEIDVALLAISLIGLWLITHRSRPSTASDDISVGESLQIGIRFVWSNPVILAAMSLDLFSVLFGGATALLPIFAQLLGSGPQGLGLLRAAPAIGSVVIGVLLAHRPPMKRAGVTLFSAVAAFGVCMIAFALSRNFWLSMALLTLSGAADNISVIIRSTMLQTMTPEGMLGRVASVNQIFIGSSNEIGAFESGVAARLLGTVPSVIFGGVMTLLVVAITSWKATALRRMESMGE